MAIGSAFRAFFALLFGNPLPEDIALASGFVKPVPAPPPAPPKPEFKPADGALQLLSILQRDARLIDFLMEDIGPYADDQVGAAVRDIHRQSREVLRRYVTLTPVVDGVEGDFTKTAGVQPGSFKLIGNVPANGKAPGGILRHKGWRSEKIELPPLSQGQNLKVIAPAELEIE